MKSKEADLCGREDMSEKVEYDQYGQSSEGHKMDVCVLVRVG